MTHQPIIRKLCVISVIIEVPTFNSRATKLESFLLLSIGSGSRFLRTGVVVVFWFVCSSLWKKLYCLYWALFLQELLSVWGIGQTPATATAGGNAEDDEAGLAARSVCFLFELLSVAFFPFCAVVLGVWVHSDGTLLFRCCRSAGRLRSFPCEHLRQGHHSFRNNICAQWTHSARFEFIDSWVNSCLSSPCFCSFFQKSASLYRFQETLAICRKSEWKHTSEV